jgi:hypothetical protein
VADIIPDAAATPPQDAPGAGTGEHHGPDVRRTTGDAELGRKLRALRRLDGRGLKESAHACGVSVSALSEYERAELKAPRARYWTTSARLGTFGGCPRRWTASASTARNATATGARRTSSS